MPNRKLNAALELFSQREKQEIRGDDLGEGEGGGGEQIVDLNIHSNALVSVFSNKIKKEILHLQWFSKERMTGYSEVTKAQSRMA